MLQSWRPPTTTDDRARDLSSFDRPTAAVLCWPLPPVVVFGGQPLRCVRPVSLAADVAVAGGGAS